ncbi:ankyrin [Hypoxylon sp. EC38]|nr:ankyrin [Hypoxylon sp. EC38]
MNLLDLPVELLHQILFFCSLSRGVKRALRLKLVCRPFYCALDAALFETGLLDSFRTPMNHRRPPTDEWRLRKDHGPQRFRHAYFVYRSRKETTGTYGEINEVSRALVSYTGSDFEEILYTLCWLALEHYDPAYALMVRGMGPRFLRQSLLSAAAYLGHMSLARELLQDGYSPISSCGLFDSPIFLAAFAGNVDMFNLLREHLPEFDDEKDFYFNPRWEGIRGALQRGDLDMFQLAASSPLKTQSRDNTDHLSQLSTYLESPKALTSTRSWKLYSYICSFLRDHPSETGLSMEHRKAIVMARHAEYGNLEMIQSLLDEGVNCYPLGYGGRIPLIKAARHGHEDVVDLLLEHGVDPNYNKSSQEGSALVAAAGGGSLAIVRKLLDHGASLGEEYFHRCLRSAITLEHTAMAKLLLEKRPVSKGSLWIIKDIASRSGLDSMVDILETIVPDQSE